MEDKRPKEAGLEALTTLAQVQELAKTMRDALLSKNGKCHIDQCEDARKYRTILEPLVVAVLSLEPGGDYL